MTGLKEKRKALDMTLDALALKVGLSLKAIWQYEKGLRFPRKENLDKLTKFFSCTIDELM